MHKRWALCAASAALLLWGCNDDEMSGVGRADGDPDEVGDKPVLDARSVPLSEIPEECRGFKVLGLTHSPGGKVLPNTCAPFDGTYNNPYAIRCIDADPDYKTQWRGDEFCILPPPPELGLQMHVGPSDYDDEAEVKPFLLEPGAEVNTNYYMKAPIDEPKHYYRTSWRMRDGSHHLIVNTLPFERPDGWESSTNGSAELGLGTGFGGSQRTDTDRPQGTLEVPAENQGIGGEITARQQFRFNLHHMNRFEQTILREVWMNVWYMRPEEVTKPMQGMTILGNPADVRIPDGQHRLLHYKSTVTGNPRVITLLGHRHANTDRFGIWIEKKSGQRISAYESFEYADMPVYQYDSVSQNPAPDIEKRQDGGHTGVLLLDEGDELHFVCDINNQSGVTLRFVNELFTGEMCIVFGSMTGAGSFGGATRVEP